MINEALELARTFSTEESVKFINGMLDAIRKKIEVEASGVGRLTDRCHPRTNRSPKRAALEPAAARATGVDSIRAASIGATPSPSWCGARVEGARRAGGRTARNGHERPDSGDPLVRQGELPGDLRRTAKIQIYIRQDSLPPLDFQIFKLLDFGDWIGVEGRLFRTKTNELTIWASRLHFLAKCLLPLPEKWHGLTDVEIRYRQRYLDLVVNPDSRRVFEVRSRVVTAIRSFMTARGYLEVETPMMQPIAGGALARPFVTHHNTLDMELYLRVAPELYLKRLVVGGLEKVFEINRNFRNEGISTQHNPEFTMMEFYQAYADYQALMTLTEELFATVAGRRSGPTKSPSANTHLA